MEKYFLDELNKLNNPTISEIIEVSEKLSLNPLIIASYFIEKEEKGSNSI
ncbi:TPA: hypothetical protein ACMU2U_001438 [Clostridioides difficile]|nr:hypothetical protein [Clostridioides difficile]EJX3465459.1 hypothetical protein [Clostridioides difficile]MBY1699998.1 hypothetical protein [Clostridioides difficile]MBY2483440.1 hypothetical protein [Clostridioides difficile]MCH4299886.1 hypothetical protein [Clostridioides difficile]MCI4304701.1 hypothetical protein [Clostridioides difficile]